jgi:DDE superfamily endonuclease
MSHIFFLFANSSSISLRIPWEKQFQNYHRVLNRAKWSPRELSRRLLMIRVHLFFAGNEPLIMGIDETIERRRGRKIAARGVYRDPVRSSREFFVKTNGLRWMRADALDSDPLGLPGVGLALFDGSGAI